jgi:hypothetical protein
MKPLGPLPPRLIGGLLGQAVEPVLVVRDLSSSPFLEPVLTELGAEVVEADIVADQSETIGAAIGADLLLF